MTTGANWHLPASLRMKYTVVTFLLTSFFTSRVR
jgi:hypothetical protein